jgi:hypothetical protein
MLVTAVTGKTVISNLFEDICRSRTEIMVQSIVGYGAICLSSGARFRGIDLSSPCADCEHIGIQGCVLEEP